nr:MAG TPA: MqsA [Caudoviricetes sp.]
MVVKKYQTTIKGEFFPVLHCTGCNHEYILK